MNFPSLKFTVRVLVFGLVALNLVGSRSHAGPRQNTRFSNAGGQYGAKSGGQDSGGGDLCEDRIQTIRDDIRSWIHAGGPRGLVLPPGLPASEYSRRMLQQIGRAKIKCVGP